VKAAETTKSMEVIANSTEQCSLVQGSTEYFSTVHYSIVHNVIVKYSTIRYSAALLFAVQCGTGLKSDSLLMRALVAMSGNPKTVSHNMRDT
jgi:hypothetical protein